MVLSDNVECSLNVRNKKMSIFDFNIELSLDCLVHMNAGLDVDESSLITPVSVE